MIICSKTRPARSPYIDQDGKVAFRGDPRGELCGKIFLIDYGSCRSEHLSNKSLFRRCLNLVLADNSVNTPDSRGNALAAQAYRDLHKHPRVRFRLARNGEIMLAYEAVGQASQIDDETAKIEIRQAYLFLKDCAHTHHHHDPADDQMIPVSELGDNDIQWRKQTLWSLTKAAGQKRRYGDWRNRSAALGILAYVQSFQDLNAKIFRSSKDEYTTTNELSTFDFTNQRQSMEILERKDTREVNSKLALIVSAIALLTSIFLGTISITSSFYGGIYFISYEALLFPIFTWIVLSSLIYDAQFSRRSYIWEPMRRAKRSLTYDSLRWLGSRKAAGVLAAIGVAMVAGSFFA